MSGIATALVASAVIGGVAANKASSKASKASSAAASEARDATNLSSEQARGDVNRLMAQARQDSNQGFQGALGVFENVVPQQSDIFQQGNINAQNTLLSGLSQTQNAILGGNVDLSQLQATQQFQPDFSFLNQQPAPTIPTETQPQSPMQGIVPPARFTGGVNFNPMDFSNMGGFRHNNMGRFR